MRADLCRYATASSPPFLIAHGDRERRVGAGQSGRRHDTLSRAGARAEYILIPGADHGSPQFDQPTLHARTFAFLRSVLATR